MAHILRIDSIILLLLFGLTLINRCHPVAAKDYYYTRTRQDPNHLRVAEEFKNKYVNEVKFESKINGTKYEYYKSSLIMSHDELVFETIDKIFKHRLSPFYIHHYDNPEDKKRSSDASIVSHEACARDLMYLVDKLPKRSNSRDPLTNNNDDHLTPELTAFFDSYARQEAGLLMGNTYWVGAYDQCVNRHIFELMSSQHPDFRRPTDEQQVISFRGRYCVSALKSPTWDSIIQAKKVQSKKYFKSERQFNDYSKLFRLQVGICLPSSCDSSSYERHADEIKLLTTSMLEQRYSDYELVDLYCLPDESSPLRAWTGSAFYFVLCMSLWIILLFLATIADIFEFVDSLDAKKSSTKRLGLFVAWFSLRANYRKLMKVTDEAAAAAAATATTKSGSSQKHQQRAESKSHAQPTAAAAAAAAEGKTSSSERKSEATTTTSNSSSSNSTRSSKQIDESGDLTINLRFLNAFKVMIMFWVINGHIMMLMIQTAKNILYSDALLNGLMHFLIGATFGVDLFFTMTGFLTSYLIFNSGHAYKMKPLTWLYLSFHRYWRLAPMYLISFWFSRSVAQLLGSGPLWDYGTSSLTFRGLCNHESWWYPLTLTSNLHGLFEECMITSWYISCDMQFWLISPLFIHLLAKSPLSGWVASIATIAMSLKVRYDSIMSDQSSAQYDELVQPRADIFMRVSHDMPALYTHPHLRITSYIVGLLAGHYVYMIKKGRWTSSVAASLQHELKLKQQQKQQDGGGLAKKPNDNNNNANASNNNNNNNKQRARAKQTSSSSSGSGSSGKSTKGMVVTGGMKARSTMAYVGLFLVVVMSFISYLLSHYYPSSMLKHAKTMAAGAYAVNHLAMSIGASLIIISMCFGQWPRVVRFLSHPMWTRLSKMNYALLLLQCEAIYFQIFRYDQVPVAGTRELINILFNLLVTLYPVAFVVTLAFEYPLANIEKILI